MRSTTPAPWGLLRHGLIASAIVMGGSHGALAQPTGPTIRSASIPTSGLLGVERVRLPNGERMGLVGGSVLFNFAGDWGVGPAVYGAASGQRGGLFVGGIELQRRWQLPWDLTLATGLFAGGGGGASAPVGSGLMLRPALTVLKDVGPSLQAGLTWSHVRFPSGDIASSQLGLTLAWRTDFRYFADAGPDDRIVSSRATGLGFDRMLLTGSHYRLRDGSGRRIGLAGARAERRSSIDGLTWGLEAAAAASGGAAGYMEILGTLGVSTALLPASLPSWRVGVRAGAGLGGGGAVDTEGGLLGKLALTTEISPRPGWTVGAEVGGVRGIGSRLRAPLAQVWVGIDLEPGLDGRGEPVGSVARTEWTGAIQHHAHVQRRDGSLHSLDTLGLKLNRYLNEHVYVSGQAHTAVAGGAGAYAVGMVGGGVASSPTRPLRAGVELMLGAAGGGGVETAGGGLAQAVAWAGWTPAGGGEWRLGVGQMRTLRKGWSTPVAELSWSRAFGMAAR